MPPRTCTALVLHRNHAHEAYGDDKQQRARFSIPLDAVKIILEFLPPVDLARAACVCRSMNFLASNPKIWDTHVFRDYNLSPREFRPPRPLSKHLYVKMHNSWRTLNAMNGMVGAGI
jgi:hypothetical protein